jgi:hypothetical protein
MPLEKEVTDAAARQYANQLGHINDKFGTISSIELIDEQQLESFQIPRNLVAILSRPQRLELEALLQQLCELNNNYAGMRAVEAESRLLLLDDSIELSDRFDNWFSDFVTHRTKKYNPKDEDEPFKKFDRLTHEFREFFVTALRLQAPNTISYIFFDRPNQYSHFLIFTECFSPYFSSIYGVASLNEAAHRRGFAFTETIKLLYEQMSRQACWHFNRFGPFLEQLCQSTAIQLSVKSRQGIEEQKVRDEIARIAKDIRYLRQFLSGSSPAQFNWDIGGYFVGLRWSLRYGIAKLCIGSDSDEVVRQLHAKVLTKESLPSATIQHDGSLADVTCPWITINEWSNLDKWLMTLALLETVYDRLFEAYSGIDFDEIRNKAFNGEITPELDDQALAVSLQDLAAAFADEACVPAKTTGIPQSYVIPQDSRDAKSARRGLRLRSIKQSELLRVLETDFDCEIRRGKGSEVIVYRKDAHIWRLGQHKRDREIDTMKLKEGKDRLKISDDEWYAKVYRGRA